MSSFSSISELVTSDLNYSIAWHGIHMRIILYVNAYTYAATFCNMYSTHALVHETVAAHYLLCWMVRMVFEVVVLVGMWIPYLHCLVVRGEYR